MKNLLKKINVFGLAVILVCGVIFTTQSAFTTLTPPADGWYEISITNPLFPEVAANQSIISTTPQTAPLVENEDGCAQTLNTGNKCFVYLDFEDTASTIPATVADVDNVNVSVSATARQPE
ncbi:hypothetical protein HDC92_003791 [Pedobacter sp. AK017]|uniref:hypothetical protein n=1 Tax=Pedobacter sp. AK017 TaxID=2723073 RepID=UPI001615CA1E|nr:hypothetical protein [Pedobacter sp. AK017]MBB5440093.1 hypothetical protein [Pedobacter sp. AK017]